jgi:hypothetical protein
MESPKIECERCGLLVTVKWYENNNGLCGKCKKKVKYNDNIHNPRQCNHECWYTAPDTTFKTQTSYGTDYKFLLSKKKGFNKH